MSPNYDTTFVPTVLLILAHLLGKLLQGVYKIQKCAKAGLKL